MCPSWLGGSLIANVPASAVGPPVPGYVWYLDATDPSNTNHVWKDKSGNGYDATALSSGGYVDPVLTPGAVNGLAAYLFPGGALHECNMQTPAFNIAVGGFTVFCVFQAVDPAPYSGPLDASYNGGYSLDYNASYGNEFWVAGSDYLSSASTDTSTHCMAIAWAPGTNGYRCYVDGVLKNTGTAAVPPYPLQLRSVGCFASYDNTPFHGYVCVCLEYGTTLSDPDIASTHTFLQGIWGF